MKVTRGNEMEMLTAGVLSSVMLRFIRNGKKVPRNLVDDLKKVRKQNIKSNNKTLVSQYYKQYRHLQKYYPKPLGELPEYLSIQRGPRAVNIEAKYEALIKTKKTRHIWSYVDEDDSLRWYEPEHMKLVRDEIKQNNSQDEVTCENFNIGRVTWYGLCTGQRQCIDYGLSSLSKRYTSGNIYVFDNEISRNDFYEYMIK